MGDERGSLVDGADVDVLAFHTLYASYSERTIRVYQAYRDQIADEVVKLGTFGPAFSLDRMTWIKPSFLWMMYRCGWGQKEGQERILAIDMKRNGFDRIVHEAVLSSYSAEVYGTYEQWRNRLAHSEVRCQWDPERDIYGNPQQRRTIQLGIRGSAIRRYVNEWIVKITDITPSVLRLRQAKAEGQLTLEMLPQEREYHPSKTA